MSRIVAVNGSPRLKWNTGTLVSEASRGAEEAGAEVQRFDLYRLERFTGCISCFDCKLAPNEGRCVCKDGLAPVLEAIRDADGLILGTPNYCGDVSATFRALYERLIFQALTYKTNPRTYASKKVPVLFIMTSNSPEAFYGPIGYRRMLKGYQQSLNGIVGSTKLLIAGDTLQVKDYSRFNWTMFNPQAKQERHEKVFPKECEKAFRLGQEMIAKPW